MTYLLALDQGTSSTRSIVFDRGGRIVAMAQREFRQIFPQPGWVEHDPQEIWQTQLETAREALAQAGLQARDLAALGITNQRETTLVWNRRTGAPIHNAIVWQDRRAEPTCAALREQGREPLVQRKTGLVIDAYFSGTKLKWILDHVDGAREQAARGELAFGTVDSWLVWHLTGGRVHATDVSNASRTSGSMPPSRSAAQIGSERRSCQTIVVSRWLVMPMPITSLSGTSVRRSTSRAVSRWVW